MSRFWVYYKPFEKMSGLWVHPAAFRKNVSFRTVVVLVYWDLVGESRGFGFMDSLEEEYQDFGCDSSSLTP